jgi:membrane protease YdiL (CAAX protease family)
MKALIFVVATFILSWIQQYFIITGRGISDMLGIFALMWTPGAVALFCSYYFDRNFKSLGIRRASFRSLAVSYGLPALVAIGVLIASVVFGVGDFELRSTLLENDGLAGTSLLAFLLIAPTIAFGVGLTSAFGEEIGWRGFLHSAIPFAPLKKYLLIGIIWAAWHWPLIVFGDYATSDKPWLNVFFFTVSVMSISVFMGYMRDKTGSVLPATVTHAAHNVWIQSIYPAFYKAGPLDPYLGGEAGLIAAVLYLGVAILTQRKATARCPSGDTTF